MDRNGVLSRCVDSSGNLGLQVVSGTPETVSSTTGRHDENWVWGQVFDPVTNAIRVVVI